MASGNGDERNVSDDGIGEWAEGGDQREYETPTISEETAELLPNFQLQFDDARNEHYLFHPYTGECIFGVDERGNLVSDLDRNKSMWTRATLFYESVEDMRREITGQRIARAKRYKSTFPPNRSIYTEEVAISILQNFFRRIYGLMRYRQKIFDTYVKNYDAGSYLFYFTNVETGVTSWCRPIGLGQSAENDIPEAVEDIMVAHENGDFGDYQLAEYKDCGEDDYQDGKTEDEELVLGFPAVKKKSPFLIGPYCKRTRGVPGRRVRKALGNKKLKSAGAVVDRFGRTGFAHPKDMSIDVTLYGEDIPALDGLVVKDATVEPYMLMRAAHEKGPQAVLDLMKKHKQNRHIIMFGCLSFCKYEIKETEDGVASVEATNCCKMMLSLCDDEWTENRAILSAALGALASLSDNYSNRIMMHETNWMSRVVKVMKSVEEETTDVYVRHADGVTKMSVTNVTRQSVDIAVNGCKLLFNMACDESNREYVADSGTPLVMYVMKFVDDNATVQHYGVLALYNFVYRNEAAHFQANEDGAMELCEEVVANFPNDDNLRRAAKRTIKALTPEGWRGNLSTTHDDTKS